MPKIINIQFDELPAALLHFRQAAGLTLEDAARRAGVSFSTISHYETGIRKPSLRAIKRLARVYGFEAHLAFVRD